MCLHPDVISYIANVIDSVKVMLESKDVEMVAMVILDESQNPLERFVFEIGSPNSNNGRSDPSHTVISKYFEHKIVGENNKNPYLVCENNFFLHIGKGYLRFKPRLGILILPMLCKAQWLSRAFDWGLKGCWFEPHSRSFSNTPFLLLSTGSSQENLFRHDWKIVIWNVKNQTKQNYPNYLTRLLRHLRVGCILVVLVVRHMVVKSYVMLLLCQSDVIIKVNSGLLQAYFEIKNAV